MPRVNRVVIPFLAWLLVMVALLPFARAQSGEKEAVLFKFNGKDGDLPIGRLAFDSEGNIYGATQYGGAFEGCDSLGCGTAFELTRDADGKWIEQVLHSFDGTSEGSPSSGVAVDGSGILYGMTCSGGATGMGTVYRLAPGARGKWSKKVIYSFNGKLGVCPDGDLISDSAGNLYATTQGGGLNNCIDGYGNPTGCGVVFELKRGGNGAWSEEVLHFFHGVDGFGSRAGLTFGSAGNMYGTTEYGGTGQCVLTVTETLLVAAWFSS